MNLKPLLSWSKKEFTELPWRKNRTLYRTLVSEIMLQQTTVATVKNHYHRFLARFPDLASLAEASEEDLLVAWKGLGYYRRARSLKKIAECIVTEYGGEFPSDMSVLQKISGIGPYTASALVAIGMDKRAVAVDANLERVISRLYGIKAVKGLQLQKEIYKLFEREIIFSGVETYRELNESLMDLGRTFCQARRAVCELCPLKKDCKAFGEGLPLAYPVAGAPAIGAGKSHELSLLRIYVIKEDKLLVYKKEKHEWLTGQYEVPTFTLSSTDLKLTQYPQLKKAVEVKPLHILKTGITKYTIMNSLLVMDEKALKRFEFPRQLEWRHISEESANLTTATLKGLAKLAKS
ncbi:MAG TPA: hypothetical protein VNJ01_08835 [Bacteriovoracaceae bacterium]|nr:hypothetical protein [Bacteriovoracaceae bacterium]